MTQSNWIIGLLVGAGFALTSAAGAAPLSKDAYKAENDRIEAQYKTDKDACSAKTGNAKDVCIQRAKAKEKVAKADNLAAYKDTEKARYDARIARAEADYAVATEKCDGLAGDQKDVCMKEAKAAEAKAKADAKATQVAGGQRTTTAKKRIRHDGTMADKQERGTTGTR